MAEDTGDDSNEDNEAPADPSPAKKRKRGRPSVGRIAKGKDFWGQVDKFFTKEIETRGRNLAGPTWKE